MRVFVGKPHRPGPADTAERFGLTEAAIRSRVEPYLDRYARFLG